MDRLGTVVPNEASRILRSSTSGLCTCMASGQTCCVCRLRMWAEVTGLGYGFVGFSVSLGGLLCCRNPGDVSCGSPKLTAMLCHGMYGVGFDWPEAIHVYNPDVARERLVGVDVARAKNLVEVPCAEKEIWLCQHFVRPFRQVSRNKFSKFVLKRN